MKWIVFVILSCSTINSWSQDKIIMLTGDTINCRISIHPWKEGVRIEKVPWRLDKRLNGYAFIVAFFNDDSVRILRPEQIKGFYSHRHTRYLSEGYYESLSYYRRINLLFKGNVISEKSENMFFRRIYQSNQIALYNLVEEDMGDVILRYFVKKKDNEKLLYFYNKSDIENIFSDTPELTKQKRTKKFKHRFKNIVTIVMEYTRLKEYLK